MLISLHRCDQLYLSVIQAPGASTVDEQVWNRNSFLDTQQPSELPSYSLDNWSNVSLVSLVSQIFHGI